MGERMEGRWPRAIRRSLVDARDGEHIELGTVMFEAIRHMCDSIGVQSGDLLQCERRTPQAMVLRRPNGQQVEVDRVYAAFIEIHVRDVAVS